MKVLGMMTGTSVDSVDGSILEICGDMQNFEAQLLYFGSYPISEQLRKRIFKAFLPETSDVALICQLNFEIGKLLAEAAAYFVEQSGVRPELVAIHGQTVYHIPRVDVSKGWRTPSTLQIGEPSFIVERLQVPVVSDFRPADMAAGGQGAPLVPFADFLLFRSKLKSLAIHNIGGISNVTYLPKDPGPEDVLAFDTGPGNVLIDQAVRKLFGHEFDEDGRIAASGKVNTKILDKLLEHPFFQLEPPKSTGREEFDITLLPSEIWRLPPEDIVATLTALTAKSIGLSYKKFILPKGLDEVIVGGGGAFNRTLMRMIRSELSPIPVKTFEEVGWNSKARESMAFAILGYFAFKGLPNNLPSATGACHPVVMGKISLPVRNGYSTQCS